MVEVRDAAEAEQVVADQTSLIQDMMMHSDQKDIRLKEMSDLDIRGVMQELDQYPVNDSPQFAEVAEPLELMNLFQNID